MRKSSNIRFLSLLLALVMILSVMPLQVLAVEFLNTTVLDGKIKVYTDGVSGQGSAVHNSDGTITVVTTATSKCAGLGSYTYTATEHKVWVENTTTETLMVDFNYAATGLGTLTIDGVSKTAMPNGNASKSLEPGEKIEIIITSPASGSGSTGASTTIVLSDFKLQDTGLKNVTVMKMAGGTTTVNGTALSADSTTVSTDYATGVSVTAAASSGYAFLGWVDSDMNVLSTQTSYLVQPLADMVVAAAFVANDAQAYWLANGKFFTDLNEACAAAQSGDKSVVLLKNGTLAAGTHTIPADISVLIPYNALNTSFGPNPELLPNGSKFKTPTPYRTLTLAAGANLVVNGTLELAARHHVSSGTSSLTFGGAIDDKFGHIATEAGSEITVNGTLYAWGIVSGKGEVVANSGGSIHEKMQIHDYRGGTATSALVTTYSSKKLFPFSQYYVQNVEVKETIHAGASLVVNAGVYLSAPEQASVAFVGGAGAMFSMSEGSYVTKQYDAAEDRLKIDAYGNVSLSSISLSFNGQSVNSAKFRLGINNNIDIRIHSGIATIAQEMVLQSGATVTVDKDAAIYNTTNVFVMDAEDWGTYARGKTLLPVYWSYANGTKVIRTGVTDAIVNINGAVISAGQVFTSGGDSIISSEGTGVYALLNPASSSATTSQLDHNSFSLGMTNDWVTISYTAAELVHGDGTTLIAEGSQYDAYFYDSFQGKWVQKNLFNGGAGYTATVTFDANGGTGSIPATVVMDYFGNAAAFMGSEYTVLAPFWFQIGSEQPTHAAGTFLGWSTDPKATAAQAAPGQYVTVSGDTTVYAVWDYESFTLTVDGVSKDVDFGTELSVVAPAPTKPGYKFTGWTATTADGTVIETPETMPAHDLTLVANWVETYTLTFVDSEGNEIFTGEYVAGDAITAPDYAPEGYSFKGWINTATGAVETVPAVMPAKDLEYQASVERLTYTITFMDGTDEIGEVTVNYGEQATLLGALIDGDKVFKGWGTTADAVAYEAGAVIDVTGNMTLYAVWHSHSYTETVTTEPGCTTEGLMTFECECGDSYTETLSAVGHTEEFVPGKAADCTNTGLTDGGKCSVCGEILTAQEEIPALGHTKETIPGKDADCTNTGLTEGTKCSVCGEILTAQEEIPAPGHTVETVSGTPADCTNPGLTDGTKCSVCGEILTAQEKIDALGHKEETIKGYEATCTNTGLTDGVKCSVCGEILTAQEEIPALGHTNETIPGKAADCINTGLTDGVKCSVCGEILTAQEEIPALGHTKETIPGKDADCTNTGLTEGTKCSVCGEILTAQEEIPALGHTEETLPSKDADCTNTGLTEGTKCSVCGEILKAQEEIDALGHKEETIPGKAADCTNTGLTDGTKCSVCGEIVIAQKEIPALGHKEETIPGYAADCTNPGLSDGSKCTVCGETVTAQKEIPALGHKEETIPGKNADCTTPGLTNGAKCTVCGVTVKEQEVIPAKGHAEQVIPGKAATCTENGLTDGAKCGVCGEVLVARQTIPAAGHKYNKGICSVCGAVETMTIYFQNNWQWSDVKLYFWGSKTTTNPTWAGNKMNLYNNDGLYDYYVMEVPVDITGMIINGVKNDGSGNRDQTPDITSGWYDGICYYMFWNNGNKAESFNISDAGLSCKHKEEVAPGKVPTCTETGLTEGTKCSLCGAVLSGQETIPAKGHKFEDGVCSVCGAEQYMTIYFQNNWMWSDVKLYFWGSETEATPDWPGKSMNYHGYDGTYDYYALKIPTDIDGMLITGMKNDGSDTLDQTPDITSGWYNGICYSMLWVDGNQTESFDISEVTFVCKHVEVTIPGYAADCTNPGLTDGTKCSVCGEIVTAQKEIPALGHKEETIPGYAADCTTPGLSDGSKCTVCGETVTEQKEIPALGHTNETIPGTPADCTNTGLTDGVKCSVCGEILTAQEEIPALGHTNETIPGTPADCTNTGLTDGVKCSVCGEILTAQEEIPALGHTQETIPGTPADCTNTGLTDGVKCSVCGEILTAQEEIPALGHNEPVYTDNGDTHSIDYPCCDTLDVAAEAHTYAEDTYTCICGNAYTGIFETSTGDLYYVENGVLVENKGLVMNVEENGHIHYYYFGCGVENCSAGEACQGNFKAQKNCRHYAEITNGLLVPGGYTFNEDGSIEHIEDTSVTGIYEIDGTKFYLMDGIKVAKGLVEIDGKFYYARSSGALVVGQDYWVSKTNGLTYQGEALKAGNYTFGEDGAIVFTELKNGFYYEDGAWYYYVNDVKDYAGLIWCDGPEGDDPGYYYVNSKGKLMTDCTYWISKNNGHMKNNAYCFDANGTMYTPVVEIKNGFYFEDGSWYYYVDGAKNYAGLIYCDGPEGNDPGYYYVNSKCQLITNCTYYISKNNGHMGNQAYTFDENGTLIQETGDTEELLNGFVEENGETFYYEDGIKTYAGLLMIDGDYYYVNSKCKLVTGCTYWISKNNGYMKNGNYTFDAEGKMILN